MLTLEARAINLQPDQTLFSEGTLPTSLFQVESGWVKLVKSSSAGRDTITEVLGQGDYFDLPSLLDGEPYALRAMCCSNGPARVRVFTRETALHEASILREAQAQCLRRLRFQRRMMAAIATERVEQRAVMALVMLGERCGLNYGADRVAFPMPLTRQEFGELIGTTTETAIRILSELRRRGWLREEQRIMTLCRCNEWAVDAAA